MITALARNEEVLPTSTGHTLPERFQDNDDVIELLGLSPAVPGCLDEVFHKAVEMVVADVEDPVHVYGWT